MTASAIKPDSENTAAHQNHRVTVNYADSFPLMHGTGGSALAAQTLVARIRQPVNKVLCPRRSHLGLDRYTGGSFTSFIGNAAFTAEGQIRAFQSGANTVVEFNTTGITGAEMHILLLNFTAGTLALSDFITAGGFALAAPSSTNRTADRVTLRIATSSLQLTVSPSQKATLPTLSRAATTGTGNRSSVPTRLPTPAIAATATGLKKRTAAISQSGTILNAADLSGQLKSLDDLFASESFAASPS